MSKAREAEITANAGHGRGKYEEEEEEEVEGALIYAASRGFFSTPVVVGRN